MTTVKEQILAKLEAKFGAGNVKIYPNGSIFANKKLQGYMKDFAAEFAPTAEQKNEQQTMDTGYGKFD